MTLMTILTLVVAGLGVGGLLVYGLGKSVDSGAFDSKETRLFIREKQFGE